MCAQLVGKMCQLCQHNLQIHDSNSGKGSHVQVYPGRTALVVSLENITENVYLGNQRSMTITNCLFRLGGAAALLSNKRRHWWSARCLPLPDVIIK